MTPDDLLLLAAKEYAARRRELLPTTGIRSSVCNAKRCLNAVRLGHYSHALNYLRSAQNSDPGYWDLFGDLVRRAIDKLQ